MVRCDFNLLIYDRQNLSKFSFINLLVGSVFCSNEPHVNSFSCIYNVINSVIDNNSIVIDRPLFTTHLRKWPCTVILKLIGRNLIITR